MCNWGAKYRNQEHINTLKFHAQRQEKNVEAPQ